MSIEDNLRKLGEDPAQESMRPQEDEAPAPTPIEVPAWVAEFKNIADDLEAAVTPVLALHKFLFSPAIRVSQGDPNPPMPSPARLSAQVEMTRPVLRILQSALDRLRKFEKVGS